jgi:hypothetical protein
MISLPALRGATLPALDRAREREAFLHIALLGMTLTVTALLGYIVTREAEDPPEIAGRDVR